MNRCSKCGRRFDRPSFYEGCSDDHVPANQAARIVNAIEKDLNDRRGLGIDSLDDETQDEIRDAWVSLVHIELVS